MKKLALVLSLVFMSLSASSQDALEQMPIMPKVAQPVSKTSKEIHHQVMRLNGIASTVRVVKVKPSEDVKAMMLEYAMNEGLVEEDGAAEFEERWVGDDNSAWDGDSLSFGLDNLAGAKSYVMSVVEQNHQDGVYGEAKTEAAVKFTQNYFEVKNAFEYLGHNSKYIKVGVTPNGAVQCGFTFQALLIIDIKEGFIYEVVMEGSGC